MVYVMIITNCPWSLPGLIGNLTLWDHTEETAVYVAIKYKRHLHL